MANVGDLFINVRAKTSGLTKGLRSARRSLTNFARSGTAIIAGIGAAFGVFKLFDFLMGSLIGHSKEFREAWAEIGTVFAELGGEFAKEFGPSLAKGISDLAEWLATSDAIRDTFRGMGEALDFLGPIFDGLAKSFMWWQKQLEKFMNWLAGSEKTMKDLGVGITDPSQIQGKEGFQREVGSPTRHGFGAGVEFGNSAEGQAFAKDFWGKKPSSESDFMSPNKPTLSSNLTAAMSGINIDSLMAEQIKYSKQIAGRVEVPQ